MLHDIAKRVDAELSRSLSSAASIFLDFNGGGDGWTESGQHSPRSGWPALLVYDIHWRSVRARILQQPTQDVLESSSDSSRARRLRSAAPHRAGPRGSREATEHGRAHLDEYQMIERMRPGSPMIALAGYRTGAVTSSWASCSGTSLQAAGRVFSERNTVD